jgi:hypothetical protein
MIMFINSKHLLGNKTKLLICEKEMFTQSFKNEEENIFSYISCWWKLIEILSLNNCCLHANLSLI